MATSNNSNNQPRRKRNKKPVKRYSEEYNNRPNPYTGYSADGNYHPEAKKRPVNNASSARARAAEEERIAAMNAAMAETAWGPSASKAQQPAPRQGNIPPTVTMPAPKWAVSNNLTAQQMAAQEQQNPAPVSEGDKNSSSSSASSPKPSPTPHSGGGHRKKNQRSRYESAKERAAKTEAKRAAVDKIAKGVAAHSVSEQMIDDIASMSDAIESMPKIQKAHEETGINWEEFYDAAFPSKNQDSSKFAGKKTKQSKKRLEVPDEPTKDSPMAVKPVILGDDELLPYDKISLENERESAAKEAAKASGQTKNDEQPKPPAKTIAAQLATEIKREERNNLSAQKILDELPPIHEPEAQPSDLDSAEDLLNDLSAAVTTVSIEEILASVEKQKNDSAQTVKAVSSDAEIKVGSVFSFDSDADSDWDQVIPSRGDGETTDNESEVQSVLSERLRNTFNEADDQISDDSAEKNTPEDDLEGVESVDLNQFLNKEEPQQSDSESSADDFVPEVIIDSAELEKQEPVAEAENPPASRDELPEKPEKDSKPGDIASEPEKQDGLPVFIEEKTGQPDVEVIIADLEDEIFAEETLAGPEEEKGEAVPGGIDVEDKIEKLAEAAEVAELFRQENEDVLPEADTGKDDSGVFNVSIDEIAVTPEVKIPEEDYVKEYQPREKTREHDENLFESVLIVDENPSIIDMKASEKQDDTLFLHVREQSENPTAVFKLPEGPIVFPTDIDDAEFQEQWLDEDEDGDDMASRNKRTRRRISAFIGAVVLLFAVIILFSAVKTVVSGFTSIGSTSEKKTEYTEFISPVVVNDPMPFESIEKADNNMLLKSSIWLALHELDETEGYEHVSDATDKIILPAENVEKAATELFGKDVQLNMKVLSEYDGSAIYYYDSIDKTFHITRSGITGPSAIITKIANKGNYISLIVGYVDQEEMSLSSAENSDAQCSKFMEYILAVESDGTYYIKSIRNYVDD